MAGKEHKPKKMEDVPQRKMETRPNGKRPPFSSSSLSSTSKSTSKWCERAGSSRPFQHRSHSSSSISSEKKSYEDLYKHIPGSEEYATKIFTYPFFEGESKKFISEYKKIMFIIRGLPGTAKESLAELIKEHFPSSIICSASNYFLNSFEKTKRSKETLAKSHDFCHRSVLRECKLGSSPIIIKNTHASRYEMQTYFGYAEEYEYTIIMLCTMDKFHCNPKILSQSNRQGLTEEYFKNRTWKNVYPFVTGFFLNSDDSFYILNHFISALDALLLDGKFCRIFDAYDKEEVLDYFQAKTLLFCVAAFVKEHPLELREYFRCKNVKNSVGKCFSLTIKGYLITKSDAFAVVQMDSTMKLLQYEYRNDFPRNDDSDLSTVFKGLSIESCNASTAAFSQSFKADENTAISPVYSYETKTIKLRSSRTEASTAAVDVNNCDFLNIDDSFIHVAERKAKKLNICDLKLLFSNCMQGISSEPSKIENVPADSADEYQVYRLKNDSWFVKPPQKVLVKSVFTGLYK